jgi:hypothetical protein
MVLPLSQKPHFCAMTEGKLGLIVTTLRQMNSSQFLLEFSYKPKILPACVDLSAILA